MSGQLETTLGLEAGQGLQEVIKAIPFMFFAFVLLIFVLLYQFRIIKPFGLMKKAELRAEQTGKLLPEDLEEEADENENKKDVNILNLSLIHI